MFGRDSEFCRQDTTIEIRRADGLAKQSIVFGIELFFGVSRFGKQRQAAFFLDFRQTGGKPGTEPQDTDVASVIPLLRQPDLFFRDIQKRVRVYCRVFRRPAKERNVDK